MWSFSAEIPSSKNQNKQTKKHFLKTNSSQWLQGAGRRDNGESLFNGDRVSFGMMKMFSRRLVVRAAM